MKTISVVTPCYNEAEGLHTFYEGVSRVFDALPYALEFVFVNDGSTDCTQGILEALAAQDARVKFIEFTRNFGQQAATGAGLARASGDAVIMMDSDLQHPPALIPEFIRRWEEGYDAVFGVRRVRSGDSLWRVIASTIGGILIRLREGSHLPLAASDFSIIDRSVVDAFAKLPPRPVMTRYQVAAVAQKRSLIPFDVPHRAVGARKYTFAKLFILLWDSTSGRLAVPHYEVKSSNLHG